MESLFKKFAENRVRYECYRLFIEGNPFLGFKQVGDAFLFRGESDGPWTYFVCSSVDEFNGLLDLLTPEDKQFAMVEDYMLEPLLSRGVLDYDMRAMRLYLPEDVLFEDVLPQGVQVRPLHISDVPWMYKNYIYSEAANEAYFKLRVETFGGFGVECDNQLVGWVLTHDDGALGMLHVLEGYRGRGFAEVLTRSLCLALRKKGILPHLAILPENVASMSLALKMGFVEDRIIHWIKLK